MPIELVETRTLTVELSETEWLALRTVERDPVGYLKQQIKRRLGSEESHIPQGPSFLSETDDY